mmetsp:Transcript_31058/g.93271  ORF Transcript_31058/g.93271 Transcript_31058/m.93271 type:complete len:256 (-) Transcript_31058:436-1203(-)
MASAVITHLVYAAVVSTAAISSTDASSANCSADMSLSAPCRASVACMYDILSSTSSSPQSRRATKSAQMVAPRSKMASRCFWNAPKRLVVTIECPGIRWFSTISLGRATNPENDAIASAACSQNLTSSGSAASAGLAVRVSRPRNPAANISNDARATNLSKSSGPAHSGAPRLASAAARPIASPYDLAAAGASSSRWIRRRVLCHVSPRPISPSAVSSPRRLKCSFMNHCISIPPDGNRPSPRRTAMNSSGLHVV